MQEFISKIEPIWVMLAVLALRSIYVTAKVKKIEIGYIRQFSGLTALIAQQQEKITLLEKIAYKTVDFVKLFDEEKK